MIEKFKGKLKQNGQTLKWFYDHFKIKDRVGITYAGFCHQLNGYAPVSSETQKAVREYLEA